MHVRSPLLGPSQSPSLSGEYLVLVQRSMALMANIATASCSRARRAASTASFSPGFYRALNSQTSAIDNCCSSNVTGRPKATGLILPEEVAGASDSELPPGCYLVERLIAVRKNKVRFTRSIWVSFRAMKLWQSVHPWWIWIFLARFNAAGWA